MRILSPIFIMLLWATAAPLFAAEASASPRTVISLDGSWQIAEGGMATPPAAFDRTVPVPGIVSLASPVFKDVGTPSNLREAFWYRRHFEVKGPIPAVALIKVGKAMFGTRVFLNGSLLGDHFPNFTPGYFDAKAALKPGQNEILIRVGADIWKTNPSATPGYDAEKKLHIPGIYDDVELILTGTPYVERLQMVPNIEEKTVTVHAWVRGGKDEEKLPVVVREAKSKQIVGKGELSLRGGDPAAEQHLQSAPIVIENCQLWSPESPFLYEVELSSSGDRLTNRFGMRSFRVNPGTGFAELNGKTYFLRGSNITLLRFFEDGECGDKPWREEWVRRLLRACKDMHWNTLRYCIGFPPELWYRLADEEGFLIQDEFPIWNLEGADAPEPNSLTLCNPDHLAAEFTEWMRERWNHPCVVIWDACNEARHPHTGPAIAKVRGLDYSNRPWDNGWNPVESDTFEIHPYHYNDKFRLGRLQALNGSPEALHSMRQSVNEGNRPVILNEYGWLWLNRDGTPSLLTKSLYKAFLGPDAKPDELRDLSARYLAADTEFWRAHRRCAAIMEFCALGYSRPDGYTSDHWVDVENLTWDPYFYRYVRDAFAPVGIMLDVWYETYLTGTRIRPDIFVTNDRDVPWSGTVRLRVLKGDRILSQETKPCVVAALGIARLPFTLTMPTDPGFYTMEATLATPGSDPVRSFRRVWVRIPEESRANGPWSVLPKDILLTGDLPPP